MTKPPEEGKCSLLKKERVLNSPENMQFWQIAQPLIAPARMLNEHAAGQGSGHLLVMEYYVLQHVLAIILCLKKLEPPEEGKSIEFPRKHAILADCTTIDCKTECFNPFTSQDCLWDVAPQYFS